MQRDNSGGVQLCQLCCVDGFFDWKKMSHFSELVNRHKDIIISSLGLGKTGEEIHLNVIEFSLGNR